MSHTNPAESALSGASVAVSGATGLIGSAVADELRAQGATVLRLTRRPPRDSSEIAWDPQSGVGDPERLSGLSAVVHLAGENIAAGRWTAARKQRIRESRVVGTRSLCESLARASSPPPTLVCASAISYYGDRGDEVLEESSPPGTGFLPEVCREWEAAADPARAAGIRVVNLRIGVVLSRRGGALAQMLLPFRLGLGGRVGPGTQYMSWISRPDAAGVVAHVLTHPNLSGPVNTVAPHPVTNAEFTRLLGKVLERWTIFPLPAFAARLALGQMADDLLLASARVVPRRLLESGYVFRYPTLEECLTAELRGS
jgi:uncharacterized protein (TIGR01777 family)